MQPGAVAAHPDRLVGQVDREVVLRCAHRGIVDRVGDDVAQIEILDLEVATLVETRQQQ